MNGRKVGGSVSDCEGIGGITVDRICEISKQQRRYTVNRIDEIKKVRRRERESKTYAHGPLCGD